MISVLLCVTILAVTGLVTKTWLLHQSTEGRITFSLCLLSISLYMYGFALYGACHGEVNFFANAFACTRAAPVLFNSPAGR
jgi:hypothetical protein